MTDHTVTDHTVTDHTEHDVRALLAERGWLERLAQRLVRDPGAAEDLAQETLLRAIDRGPAVGTDPARRRGWLSTVLRNLAFQRHRAEARRRDRERAWAPFEEGDAESLRRAQLRRDLVDEVLRLPEPERSAVTLRYLEGRSYAEIAAAQSTTEPAARKRVSRGIARLRERLDEQHGGRAAWTALVLPWIGQDTTPAAAATAAAATPLTGAWILTMKTQTKLAVAAAAVLAAGMFAWTQLGRTPGGSGDTQRDERADAQLSEGAELESIDAEGAAAERAAATTQESQETLASVPAFPDRPAGTTGTLELRLVWSDGSPGAGVSANLIAWRDPRPILRARHHVADEEGFIVAEGLTAGRVTAYLDRSNGGSFDVRAGSTTTATLELPRGFTVRGRVTAPDGSPLGGAEIVLSNYGNDGEAKVVGESDADGSYSVRGVEDGRSISARVAGFAPSAAVRVGKHPEGTEHVVDLELAPGGAHLSGTVRDGQGTPLRGAFVRISPAERETPGNRVKLHPIEVWTDDAGGFDVPVCGAGRVSLWVRTELHRPLQSVLTLEPGERRDLDLVMERGATLVGRVTRADGTPASNATVSVGDRYRGTAPRGFRVTVGADGAFELPGLFNGRHTVHAHEQHHGKFEGKVQLGSSETARLEIQLVQGRTITGVVLDERGEPLADWRVGTRVGVGLWDRHAYTDAQGTFTLADVREDAVELHVAAPGKWGTGTVTTAPITDEPMVVTIPDASRPSASIRLRVLADGRVPDPGARVEWRSEAGFGRTEVFTDADGEALVEVLRPGPCRVSVFLDGFATARRRASLSADETEDLGVIEMTRGGRVAVELTTSSDEPERPRRERVTLHDDSGQIATFFDLEDGKGVSDPIEPGRYQITSGGNVLRGSRAMVEVVDGETTRFSATCEPGAVVALDFDSPIPDHLERGFLMEIRDPKGQLFRRTRTMLMSGGPDRMSVGGLPAGVWTIRVVANGERAGEVTVDVTPGAEPPPEATIELR